MTRRGVALGFAGRAFTLAAAATATLAAVSRGAVAGDAPTPVELAGPAEAEGSRVLDLDGDGVDDLLVVSRREAVAWRGLRGRAPDAAPTWRWTLPPTVTYVSAWRAYGEGEARRPALLGLAGTQALRLLPGLPPIVEEGFAFDAAGADPSRAVLAPFASAGGVALPTDAGTRWIPDAVGARTTAFDLPVAPRWRVVPAGPFLEDAALVERAWARPFLAPARDGRPASAWIVGGDALEGFLARPDGLRRLAYPLASARSRDPAATRVEHLLDLDGDGLPDLVEEATTNRSATFAFFRPRPPTQDDEETIDLGPSRGVVRLLGFTLPPEFPDLDGDGRLDLVVTSIEIDARNIMSAITRGVVTARTRAFLGRASGADGDAFAPTPDAERASEVGVRLRFTYSGSIEVRRSFTITPGADLDGDGRRDLVVRTGRDRLTVYAGTKEGVWASQGREVAIPPMGDAPDVDAIVGDLTGDGHDDLVLRYVAPPGGRDRLVVLPMP